MRSIGSKGLELSFGRLRDRFIEDDPLIVFFDKLNEAKLGDSLTDKVRWSLNSKGCFTVRSFYLKLLDGCGSLSLGTISEGSFLTNSFGGLWLPLRFPSLFGKLHVGRF